MKKLIGAYILGILSFLMAITGFLSLFLSIPGLILAIVTLKDREKKVIIPIGYQGKLGKKKLSAQPFITNKYLSYLAILLNAFSIAVSLFATFAIFTLFTAGTSGINQSENGIERVSKLPEVVEFQQAVEEGGRSTFHVDIAKDPTADERFYLIQVFELFPDHRTTFGWYRYNPDEQKIYRNDIVNDTWEEVVD
ncbi:hypothetical protein HYW55_03850 [Candidatus Gottesmanbacteria bacterium]|nr:hypothetical protein [Candidatus Gottesmanbacteria bacterium]